MHRFNIVFIMKKSRTLKDKILLRISLKDDKVFVRDDFCSLGGYDQVGRALKELVFEKKIIKIGYGLYAKAKLSTITGFLVPQASLPDLALEALSKIGVKTGKSLYETKYNLNESTQVPTGRKIAVFSRISRKIGYNGVYINYEQASR